MNIIENEVELYRIRKVDPVYKKRDNLLKSIPYFWNIVLSQHSDFANYIRASDFKYIEAIKSLIVEPLVLKDSGANPRDFQVVIEFDEIENDLPSQRITKVFKVEKDVSKILVRKNRTEEDDELDGEVGFLTSQPVDVKWPKSYQSIDPQLIQDKTTAEGKKNYRTGMKTFFAWFRWTGLKPGKEFPNGDGLANLFNEELYPFCVKYYTEAQRDVVDESDGSSEEDSDAPLNLDLEDNEDSLSENEPSKKKSKLN